MEEAEDNAAMCHARIAASTTYGEAELDQGLAPGVEFRKVSPQETGFAAWARWPERQEKPEDRDRGHADWAVPEDAAGDAARILYCHGGGYEWYSPQDMYRPVTSRLAAATGMPVFCFDYRKAPEHRHPAQLEDAVAALRHVAHHGPSGPGGATSLFLAGDSAGGGLALALALRLRDEPIDGITVAGVSVVSPMTDLTCSGESYTSRRWREGGGTSCDPVFRGADPAGDSMDQIYRLLGRPGEEGSFALTDPSISPLHAELHGLPPTQIHVGDAEVMRSDAVDFGEKARAAGSPVDVVVWPKMWHVFTQYTEGCGGEDARPLQEALDAVQQQGAFFRRLAAAAQ